MIDKERQTEVATVLARVDQMLNNHITRVTVNTEMTREQKLEAMMFVSFVASSASMLLAGCRQLANVAETNEDLKKLYDDTMASLSMLAGGAEVVIAQNKLIVP